MSAQDPAVAAERLDCSPAYLVRHQGEHRCWDGATYADGCLLTDPELEPQMRKLIRDGIWWLDEFDAELRTTETGRDVRGAA